MLLSLTLSLAPNPNPNPNPNANVNPNLNPNPKAHIKQDTKAVAATTRYELEAFIVGVARDCAVLRANFGDKVSELEHAAASATSQRDIIAVNLQHERDAVKRMGVECEAKARDAIVVLQQQHQQAEAGRTVLQLQCEASALALAQSEEQQLVAQAEMEETHRQLTAELAWCLCVDRNCSSPAI
jgi:hypothetical protein